MTALLGDTVRLDWLSTAGRREDAMELLADLWQGELSLRVAIDPRTPVVTDNGECRDPQPHRFREALP